METYIRDALAAGIQPSLSPLGVDFFFVVKKDKCSAWHPGVKHYCSSKQMPRHLISSAVEFFSDLACFQKWTS